jgi:hypothetical protein
VREVVERVLRVEEDSRLERVSKMEGEEGSKRARKEAKNSEVEVERITDGRQLDSLSEWESHL